MVIMLWFFTLCPECHIHPFQPLRLPVYLVVPFQSFLYSSESIRGLSSSFLFKYADSVVESFTSCTALILASFIVSLILQKEIGYPVITGKTPPLLHVCILPGRYKSVYCHIPV